MDVPSEQHPHPRRSQAERRAATRQKLLAVARQLFGERGYSHVSADEIVQAAGMTRGALYHHFPKGKEDLLAALYDQIQGEVSARLDAIACAYEDTWQGLCASFQAYLQACLEPEMRQIVLRDAPANLSVEVFRALDAQYGVDTIEADLEMLVQAGALPPYPVRGLAYLLVGAVQEAALWIANAQDAQSALNEASLWLGHVLDGIVRRS